MSLDDYLQTRVVEMAVHGIDVADALDQPTWTTPRASRLVAELLIELLAVPLPSSLDWLEADLLRFGTGRRDLDAGTRQTLGPLADAFPLIS